jgi:hypothetical protein
MRHLLVTGRMTKRTIYPRRSLLVGNFIHHFHFVKEVFGVNQATPGFWPCLVAVPATYWRCLALTKKIK